MTHYNVSLKIEEDDLLFDESDQIKTEIEKLLQHTTLNVTNVTVCEMGMKEEGNG